VSKQKHPTVEEKIKLLDFDEKRNVSDSDFVDKFK